MSSQGYHAAPHPGGRHGPHTAYAPQAIPLPQAAAPAGTFSPGTKIQVGSHRVVIQKYLSEGGFAHVYLVKLPSPVDGTSLAVLKRVAVPDKDTLRGMRTEVETMKRLKGHRPIVTYIDSHASEMKGGGYEVFLLMEYCDGGGLIDFMNTRLQHRLTEPEILHIFADVAEGVACMHYLKPPLLHRDLKVENVLIVKRGSSKRFKVCDFGSAAPPRPAPTTIVECRAMDEDVQRHTTLQYRAPEMVDVYRKQPLDEKSDIWALGVFLYKLCYYTTPFEDQGQLAILNASFKFPSHPVFSDRLRKLIGSMLRESMQSRPNIYQVLKEACAMQGRQVPISDIYSGRDNETRSADKMASSQAQGGESEAPVGAVFAPAAEEEQSIPNIVPMRRGRPAASPGPQKGDPGAKVTEGDPFAALDSNSNNIAIVEADDIASRFPTLDEFSLLHDQGAKFDFDISAASTSPPSNLKVSKPTPEQLADETFRSSQVSPDMPARESFQRPASEAQADSESIPQSKASTIISSNPDLKAITSAPYSRYVSTGTMTVDLPPRSALSRDGPGRNEATPKRSASILQKADVLSAHSRPPHLRRPSLSSRPSLEDNRHQGRTTDAPLKKTVATLRPRPASTSFETSTLDFLKDNEHKTQKSSTQPLSVRDSSRLHVRTDSKSDRTRSAEDILPEGNASRETYRETTTSLRKKISESAAPVPKKIANKLGDALSRFEGALTQQSSHTKPLESPKRLDVEAEQGPVVRHSTNALIDLDEDDKTPEMRREVERQKLEEEERRVAAAQAAHRSRTSVSSGKPAPGPKHVGSASRATSSIQSRVQSLLNEDQKPVNIQRTAQGYGKYTDEAASSVSTIPSPTKPRKLVYTRQQPDTLSNGAGTPSAGPSNTTASDSVPTPTQKIHSTGSKPPAPKKKPTHLNSLPTGSQGAAQTTHVQPARTGRLVDVEVPGPPISEMSTQEKREYIKTLNRRFPSLSSIEMEAEMDWPDGSR